MGRFIGIFGILFLLFSAYLMSNNRKKISFKTVFGGIGLQLLFALFILKTPVGLPIFRGIDLAVKKLLSFADKGTDFLFYSFVSGTTDPGLLNIAFRVLPSVIFFSSCTAVLYHLGIMPFIIKHLAKFLKRTLKTNIGETISVAANVFVGQVEAPLLVKPLLNKMSRSEIMTVMVGGFATIAGSVMAIYVQILSAIPNIAGHLMTASVMSAPAAIVVAKMMYPETEKKNDNHKIAIEPTSKDNNVIEAMTNGAITGLKLAAYIGAMLIATVAMVSMVDGGLSYFNTSLAEVLGIVFQPLAFLMGAPWHEADELGRLLGEKIVLTELIAFQDLSVMQQNNALSERTTIIASYALCGFANFASIGVQLGGLGVLAPKRKADFAKLAFKAMIGGAIASWITACIAGILI